MEAGLVIFIITLITALILKKMGRDWGIAKVWVPYANDRETSQAFMDPYTLTHVMHGILLYWLFGSFGSTGLLLSVGLECFWEIAENTDRIIQRYRKETIALGYNGDSVLNSVGDILAMVAGYVLASHLPWYASLGLFTISEIGMASKYKDNLTLNMLMLAYPVRGIKEWQQRESFTTENASDLDAELLEYSKQTTQTFVDHLKEKHADNPVARDIVRGWRGEVISGDLGEAFAAYEVPTGRLFIDPSTIKKEGWVTEERMNGILLHELAHAHAEGHAQKWVDAREFLFRTAIVELGWKIDVGSDELQGF